SNPPVVTSVSPISGPSGGGTWVSIAGSNFAEASSVRFGSVGTASVIAYSPTSLMAQAPAGSGTVDVTVSTIGGTSATSPADQFTYTFSNGGFAIALSASTTSPAAGGQVVLTAKANQDVGPTAWGMEIWDVTTNTELVDVGSGSTAS